MSQTASQLAVLFSDLCQSTRLYQALGDQVAQGLVTGLLAQMNQTVTAQGGAVVKTVGDEVMAVFAQAADALACAVALHRLVAALPSPAPGLGPLALHSGLHWGQVIGHGGDVFGDAVNLAARLRALAKPGQVLASRPTLEAAAGLCPAGTRLLARLTVKGRQQEVDVHELLWEAGELTSFLPLPELDLPLAPGLSLRLGGQEVQMGPQRPLLSMGRDPGNDLVVREACVSRRHARLEWRQGRCLLSDQSTNGTFIRRAGGPDQYLKLDATPLEGAGVICLGRQVDENLPQAIFFRPLG